MRRRHLRKARKSMALDHKDVKDIANLARLAISDENIDKYSTELSSILDLVEQMNAVDTNGVQRLRADVVTESNNREKYMANAPAQEEGLFLVPKVVE